MAAYRPDVTRISRYECRMTISELPGETAIFEALKQAVYRSVQSRTLLDLENIGIAVEISLLSRIQAKIYVIS